MADLATARLVTEWDQPACASWCAEHRDQRLNERRVWAVVCNASINECGLISLPYPNRAAAIEAARKHTHKEARDDDDA